MGRRALRQKSCDRCTQVASVLYRVQHDRSGVWTFICPDCWLQVSQNNPCYVYGGTWKACKK